MHPEPVYHDPRPCFYIVAIFPIAITFVCLCVCFGFKHVPKGRLPTLPEAVMLMPESRIYSVSMTIVAFCMIPVFLVIDRLIQVNESGLEGGKRSLLLRLAMNLCAVIAFLSVILFSSVTLKDNLVVNRVSVGLFWFSLCGYGLIKDIRWSAVHMSVHRFDWMVNMIAFGCLFIAYPMMLLGRGVALSFSAAFGYVGITAVFVKFILMSKTLPPFRLQLVRKSQ